MAETYGKNICDGHLEIWIIFIPSVTCSSGEWLLPSWATCYSILHVSTEYVLEQVNTSLAEPTCPVLANSVDPDQLASEEANWSGSALFAIKYVNL